MPLFLSPLTSPLLKLNITAIVDILVVAFLIYQLIMIVRGTRAAHILAGLSMLMLVYLISVWTGLELLRSILAYAVPYTAIALIVLFQSEIRRTLARIGRRRWFGFGGRLQHREFTAEILLALNKLSQQKIGVLIVMERDIGLRTFIESGVLLDSHLSSDLLFSIFQPGGALHDGAVVVQRDRIAAAACFLPLSMNPALSRKLGTRHRAAIGITEETDCLALVVSEETGRFSIAAFGEIELDVTLKRVKERIDRHFGRPRPEPEPVAGSASGLPLDSAEAGWRKAGRP